MFQDVPALNNHSNVTASLRLKHSSDLSPSYRPSQTSVWHLQIKGEDEQGCSWLTLKHFT